MWYRLCAVHRCDTSMSLPLLHRVERLDWPLLGLCTARQHSSWTHARSRGQPCLSRSGSHLVASPACSSQVYWVVSTLLSGSQLNSLQVCKATSTHWCDLQRLYQSSLADPCSQSPWGAALTTKGRTSQRLGHLCLCVFSWWLTGCQGYCLISIPRKLH